MPMMDDDLYFVLGWESQLLESGFLAAFLCPLFTIRRLPKSTPTPIVVIWGYRWLIFRIMLGAVSLTLLLMYFTKYLT